MGCANSHSEDIHRTSLLESDKFVSSLQDVPGYFNRTIQTADFLPPKFPDAPPKKPEMSYTGPPSHLQNSVDFHPYWHLIQQEYVSSESIKEIHDGEMPSSLQPYTETAQELRDIEVREAITDLRQRVRDSITEKLKENEEDFLAALSGHGVTENSDSREYHEHTFNSDSSSPGGGKKPHPPPLPAEDYPDGSDNSLAQDEKDTMDFLDSVINESMAWDEETGEEVFRRKEDSNWSFAHPPPEDESQINQQAYDPSKPLPGLNLDIASMRATPPNSPTSFSKSIYLPDDKNSFISNNVLARQASSMQISTLDRKKQVTQSDSRTSKTLESPGRKLSQKKIPPPPPQRAPPPLLSRTFSNGGIGNSSTSHSSRKIVSPPPPPPPPLASRNNSPPAQFPPPPPPIDYINTSNRTERQGLISDLQTIQSSNTPQPTQPSPPPPTQPSPPPAIKTLERKTSAGRGNKVAPVKSKTAAPTPEQRASTLERQEGNSAPPPAPKPRPKQPAGVKLKPVRHSMIEMPTENTITEDLPSDDSGIREEVTEKSIHDIIKNLKLSDTTTLERKAKGKVPPPTAKKPKPARPMSMPPQSSPPTVKPKPQRKPHGPSSGRNSSFNSNSGGTRRHLSDDASSEDSGLHMKDDSDILSQIRVQLVEERVT